MSNHPYWHAPLNQILAIAFNIANSPCERPNNGKRCAASAKGALEWMCQNCQMRQLRFGEYCGTCMYNHVGPCS